MSSVKGFANKCFSSMLVVELREDGSSSESRFSFTTPPRGISGNVDFQRGIILLYGCNQDND